MCFKINHWNINWLCRSRFVRQRRRREKIGIDHETLCIAMQAIRSFKQLKRPRRNTFDFKTCEQRLSMKETILGKHFESQKRFQYISVSWNGFKILRDSVELSWSPLYSLLKGSGYVKARSGSNISCLGETVVFRLQKGANFLCCICYIIFRRYLGF